MSREEICQLWAELVPELPIVPDNKLDQFCRLNATDAELRRAVGAMIRKFNNDETIKPENVWAYVLGTIRHYHNNDDPALLVKAKVA
jgi:hypothetical protein